MSTLDHLKSDVKVWDGKAFSYVDEEKAMNLEAAGSHQICTNLQAKDLKSTHQFNLAKAPVEPEKEPKAKPKLKTKPSNYQTKVSEVGA